MSTGLQHELELIRTELAEALNEIERYERVATGNYTPAELKDKGDPIQKLAATYEAYKAYQEQNREYLRQNSNLLDKIRLLEMQLKEALKAVPASKRAKLKEEPLPDRDILKHDMLSDMYLAHKANKSYFTTADTTGVIRWSAIEGGGVIYTDQTAIPVDPNAEDDEA